MFFHNQTSDRVVSPWCWIQAVLTTGDAGSPVDGSKQGGPCILIPLTTNNYIMVTMILLTYPTMQFDKQYATGVSE